MRTLLSALILLSGLACVMPANAQSHVEVICAYAPSQNKIVQEIRKAAAGARYGQMVLLVAGSLQIVKHSSGGPIVTGPGGYIRGTMPMARAAVVTTKIAVIVGAAALTVELACAPINHPELVAIVISNSQEYWEITLEKYRALTGYTGTVVSASISRASEYWHNRIGEELLPAAVESLNNTSQYWQRRLEKLGSSSVADSSADVISGVRAYWIEKLSDW